MRASLRVSLFSLVAGGLIAAASSCSGTPAGENDAGTGHTHDAGTGTGQDSGTEDAGVDAGHNQEPIDAGEDAGSQDAGDADAGEQDAGEPDAGETDAGCVDADPETSVLWQVIDQDWGWPIMDPACYSTPADCNKVYTLRFTDAATFATWYGDELQRAAPTVNFSLADVLVTYSCGCPTMGYSIKTIDVTANDCNATQFTEFDQPDSETCLIQQTFTRPFSTVTIPKGAGVTEKSVVQTKINVCL